MAQFTMALAQCGEWSQTARFPQDTEYRVYKYIKARLSHNCPLMN